MSEYVQFIGEYPNIDFAGNRTGSDKSLFLLEAPNIHPQNYHTETIKKYKKVYTWNSKLYSEYRLLGMDVVQLPNFPLFDNYSILDKFTPFEDKVNGVCLMCRHREKPSCEFDISYNREQVMFGLSIQSVYPLELHCYGRIPYCGIQYKGVIGDGLGMYPSSLDKLKMLDKYRFNLCFENAYHELWSWDYITEKITDCFKAKCVPIYWGCYNIQERIPKELYVDYREFKDVHKLAEHLNSISKEQYIDMTEKAFEWEKETKLGNIEELRSILDND